MCDYNLIKPTLLEIIKQEYEKNSNFNELKYKLIKNKYKLKETNNTCIVYSEYSDTFNKNSPPTESFIIEKSTLRIIVKYATPILYNNDATNFLKKRKINWENIIIEQSYEGHYFVLYYNENKWNIGSRKCLNATQFPYKNIFDETKLNKNYCYHFILVHHKNKNIVDYSKFMNNKEYEKFIHVLTTEKYTLNEISDVNLLNNSLHFSCLDEVVASLENISSFDQKNNKVSSEGFIIKIYEGAPRKSSFIVLKLQTKIYQYIKKFIPFSTNIDQCYLELYQRNKLTELLPYFSDYVNLIKSRVHNSMKNLSGELLNIYHNTRNKRNREIYKLLPSSFKQLLYDLHGIYLSKINNNPANKYHTKISEKLVEPNSLNIHDVYYYLKNIQFRTLIQIFYDRLMIIKNNQSIPFINKNCIYLLTQSTLMFNINI